MVYMYHSFLVHSSADGHLGCFQVLAMTNSAAMNIGVHVSLSDLISLVCMPPCILMPLIDCSLFAKTSFIALNSTLEMSSFVHACVSAQLYQTL